MGSLGINTLMQRPRTGKKLPVLFIGHGSPMNAIEENAYTKSLNKLGRDLPRPEMILCISAHWMTRGTYVTAMENPKTIHDFYGFPKELFDVQYPAPGSPELANAIHTESQDPVIGEDHGEWGLDHGTWAVLKHMYPEADIPVVQLSLDMTKGPEYHFELGVKLRELRERGVLIVGSGNIVHNLKLVNWKDKDSGLPWAEEFDLWAKEKMEQRDFESLQKNFLDTEAGRLSVPTMDHYYPLLYTLGASDEGDKISYPYEGLELGSMSMRSVQFG